MAFKRISIDESMRVISEDSPVILDIRDPQAFAAGLFDNALHLDNSNISEFIEETEKSVPLLVYCYHGNMSQGAAGYLEEQGFTTVYSVDGGFEEWRLKL